MRPEPTMISVRTGLLMAVGWAGMVVLVTMVSLVWGGTITRCKPNGYVSGAVFRATDADCLDTRVLNEVNSQLDNTNFKTNANIAGYKIDGVIASLSSTRPIVIGSPGLILSSLGSTTRLISVVATLVITDGLRLQSTHDYTTLPFLGSVATPPVPNTLYANTFVKAMALYSASQIDTQGLLLASFNVGLISRVVIGRTLVSLLVPMGSDFYVAQATPVKIGNDRNPDQVFQTVMTSFFGTFGTYRRQYFEVITLNNNAYADNSFSLVVIGQ